MTAFPWQFLLVGLGFGFVLLVGSSPLLGLMKLLDRHTNLPDYVAIGLVVVLAIVEVTVGAWIVSNIFDLNLGLS